MGAYLVAVQFWGKIWFGEVYKDSAEGGTVRPPPHWALRLWRVEFWVLLARLFVIISLRTRWWTPFFLIIFFFLLWCVEDFQFGWSMSQASASGQTTSRSRSFYFFLCISILSSFSCAGEKNMNRVYLISIFFVWFRPSLFSKWILHWYIYIYLVSQMAMQGFAQKIVQMMKSGSLFASQGGPIILSQAWFFLFSFSSKEF